MTDTEINSIRCKELKDKSLSCKLSRNGDLVEKVDNVKLIHAPTEAKVEYNSVSGGFEMNIQTDKGVHCQIEKNENSNKILCR